jgi:hypothetical protein
MLTHYNIINNGKSIGDCMNFSTDEKADHTVPLFHVSASSWHACLRHPWHDHGAAGIFPGRQSPRGNRPGKMHGSARRADHVHRPP